ECLADTACQLGEGPDWDAGSGRLYWVDILAGTLHFLDSDWRTRGALEFGEPLCAVSPEQEGGLLLAAFAKRLAILDPSSGKITQLAEVEPQLPHNRCNDGKRDPAGRFWIGTMSTRGENGAGALYRWDPASRSLDRILEGLTISNGLDWSSSQRTMFFTDSPAREVWAFDFDPATSAISNRRTVVRVPPELGVPDGLCVAEDDTLWVAHWGAGCVCRWDPANGHLIEKVLTGCPHTTSCCLGPDGRLFITTARAGLDAEALARAPLSGAVFLHRTR
ncbi:MAG: SMP-30/gluconolactonase/LRE family protein, partial [Terrimicrobiaceae bacterium]|nr:SMP-30/gluconolactonase/LRE family protein [Terrimicrobiaceae bacterium]